jgi:predicted SnoaL-like aldol condensation-catalyzing enzyme
MSPFQTMHAAWKLVDFVSTKDGKLSEHWAVIQGCLRP